MEEVLETACSSAKGSEEKGAIGNALGPRSGQSNGVMSRDTGNDLTGLRKGFGDDGIRDPSGLLLVRGTDPGKDDDLLDWTTVLFVDLHDIEKSIDSDELGSGNASDSGVVDRHRKVVRLETPGETTNAYLAQDAHLAGNLGLQYHSDTDTFSVKNGRGQNGFDGVADSMAEIDKIA